MPRKHLIASGINKKQQQQAKTWMKLAKEIKAAAKVGGPNPEANPRLKAAIDKALENNLSRDSIQRNINGPDKDSAQIVDVEYECYGPNGLAIIVKALTDNQNRTLSNLRGYLNKLPGEISKPNSVKMLFDYKGEILIEKESYSEDDVLNKILECEMDDLVEMDNCFQIITSEGAFYNTRDFIKNAGFKIIESAVKFIPNSYTDLNTEQVQKLERFLDSCEDDDDIQWVVNNFGEEI